MTLGTLVISIAITALLLTLVVGIISRRINNWLVSYFQNFCGALFIFSGWVKAIDPLGTAYKLEQYFAEFESTFNGTWFSFLSPLFPWLAEYAIAFSVFMIVLEIVLGIMLYLDVVQYFIGKDFREGLGVVPLLLISYLFLGLYYNFSIWYKLADRTLIGGYIALGGSVITIALNVWLIPDYGYYGPGWAALACYLFMAGASYWTGQRYYPINYPVGRMTAYILLAVLFYGASEMLRGVIDGRIGVSLIVNTGLMLGYLAILYVMERRQVNRILGIGKTPAK